MDATLLANSPSLFMKSSSEQCIVPKLISLTLSGVPHKILRKSEKEHKRNGESIVGCNTEIKKLTIKGQEPPIC